MARFDHEDQLADIMRQFFETRDAARALRVRLETQRREMGVSVAAFYDPRSNPVYAADILRHLDLRQNQANLLEAAERKVTGQSSPETGDKQNEMIGLPFSLEDENLGTES
ncbi:hypothetical protein V6582_23025 [Agrobacterium vitis]|uniref:hypothetical protein n=1 Tax=Agrobacterium vitis TaxID=373 RepID=UPI0012E8F589|nr:hypothetical protein [Agrobacterium vitis]MVA25794.1 hypothetical protein [Agrobacterium vitis]